MRTGLCIVVAGALIAAAIMVTNRYTVDRVYLGQNEAYVYGLDSWTGEPFAKRGSYPVGWPKE
jgi:hypothetical protein